nr:hypothetical protein [Bradyrhizobium jicamae]
MPIDCEHNGHLYYVLLRPEVDRQAVLRSLKDNGVYAVFHYVPLLRLRQGAVSGARMASCR